MGITWQPIARFSQITPQFVQNFMTNTLPVFLFENLVPHRDWGLVGEFGANGPKMVFEEKLGNPLPDLHKKPLILFRIPCKKDQTFLLKI